MKELLKPFIEKATSGKFLFTMVAALVFAILSLKHYLPQDKVMEVILIVIYAYFQKNPTQNGGTK
jgi:hypothetical protein